MSGCTYRRRGQSRGSTPTISRHTPESSPTTCPMPDAPGIRASLVHYLTIAGERAFDAAAFDDAVGYFEKALSLMPDDDQLGRAQLLERLAMALRSVGRWEDALGTMNDALDRYQTLGQVEAIGRLGWAMVYQLVWTARLVEGVAGRPADAGGTRQHRQRRQSSPAVSAGVCDQRQRRLCRGDGHVRPGACAC